MWLAPVWLRNTVAYAGTWNGNFAIEPKDLLRVSNGVLTDLKRD